MTAGVRMTPEKTFEALRPAALDDLAQDGYDRRRDTDLGRIMTAERTARRGVGRPSMLLLTGVAAAAVVAGGVVVVSGGGQDEARSPVPQSTQLDARSFLLASAQAAERVRVKPGRYWYTRERTQISSNLDPRQKQRRPTRNERLRKPRIVKLPYTYRLSGGQESWLSRTGRDRTRTITAIDVRLTFPTTADRAAWRKAGAPDLIEPNERKPSVNNYDEPMSHQIGSRQVKTDTLLKLPTDAAALGAELRRRYQADVKESGGPANVDPFPYYVWMTAQDLLAGPITPGTKAALYRVLAQQPGVRSGGMVTDQLGRRGMAVVMRLQDVFNGRQSPEGDIRLIIDPKTAQLLAYESGPRDAGGAPALSLAYEKMGWVDRLDGRP